MRPAFFAALAEAALAQNRVRLLEVAVRLRQGVLALHHPRARLVAELLDLSRRNCRSHRLISPVREKRRRAR